MKTYRLKIAADDLDALQKLVLADMPCESGAFALAGVAHSNETTDVLVRRVIEVPKGLLHRQEKYNLDVSSQAVNGLVALCEQNALGAVLCHSHPEDSPYSPSDDRGERRIFEVLRSFVPKTAPMASLLVSPSSLKGRVWDLETGRASPFAEIIVLGRSIRRLSNPDTGCSNGALPDERYSRQVLAFGSGGQRLLAATKVGIVGVGGTGSAVVEQLARLGSRDIVLLDPDRFERSNVTRMYGSSWKDGNSLWRRMLGRCAKKAAVVARHVRRINPEAKVRVIPESVVVDRAARAILDRDVIFLCTDEHWGRAIVTRIAHQYLIPTINMGMRITSDRGTIQAGIGNIDVLRPGKPCLWCRQVLNANMVAAESMPTDNREALAQEGYVQGVEGPAPSVISVTTSVASLAVTLFLQLLTDFMGRRGDIANLGYDIMAPALHRGTATIPSRCLCRTVKGYGDMKPLPTLPADPRW